jgi:hypothetical protein
MCRYYAHHRKPNPKPQIPSNPSPFHPLATSDAPPSYIYFHPLKNNPAPQITKHNNPNH